MKKIYLSITAIGIIAIFVLYMITYQVNFSQSAILVTFGRASAENVINANGKSAGLYFKYPWPIQKVKLFDRRLMVFKDRLEQQETNDKQVVIIKAYATWRISNPLDFYRSLKTIKNGEVFLRERLRSARSEVGNFTFDDLTNLDPEKLKIGEVENAILERMKRDMDKQKCGVEIVNIGISRILLPEQITISVISRMRQTRQRLAQSARSKGYSIAKSIMAKADSDKQRIMAFAEREAQAIKAEGDATAANYYKIFARNKKFAVFLRKLEALQNTLSNNTTFLLDTEMVPFDLLKGMNHDNSVPGLEDKVGDK